MISTLLIALAVVSADGNNAGWVTHKSINGDYTVLLPPGKPTEEDKQPDGSPMLHKTELVQGQHVFVIMTGLNPTDIVKSEADAQRAFVEGRDRAVKSTGGKLVQERERRLGTNPGWYFVVEHSLRQPNGANVEIVEAEWVNFVDRRQLYMLRAIVPRADYPSADIDRFFDSFALTKTAAADDKTPAGWARYKSVAGGFSVLFPSGKVTEQDRIELNSPMHFTYVRTTPDEVYTALTQVCPASTVVSEDYEQINKDQLDKDVKARNGTLRSHRRCNLGKHPGWESIVESKNKAGQEIIEISRTYYVKNKDLYLFGLAVMMLRKDYSPAKLAPFFDSFTLTNVVVEKAPPPKLARPKMAPFTSAAGKFTINLPGKPKESTEKGTAAGYQVETKSFLAEFAPDDSFSVRYSDLPAVAAKGDAVPNLNAVRDAVLKATAGKVLKERRMTMKGFVGRHYEIDVPKGASGLPEGTRVEVRFYQARNRLYEIVRKTPKDDRESSDSAPFFDSFKINP